MAINFPSSPSVGQKHPVSPVPGLPTYTWDGEKWTTVSSAIEGFGYVLKSGDTMSGDLTITRELPRLIFNNVTADPINKFPTILSKVNGVTCQAMSLAWQVGTGYGWSLDYFDTGGVYVGSPVLVDDAGRMSLRNDLTPQVTGTLNLGSAALRWGTVYTSDLSLDNGVGDWTIVEGEDELFIYNNKRGKSYKFVMIEVDPSHVPPKKV